MESLGARNAIAPNVVVKTLANKATVKNGTRGGAVVQAAARRDGDDVSVNNKYSAGVAGGALALNTRLRARMTHHFPYAILFRPPSPSHRSCDMNG